MTPCSPRLSRRNACLGSAAAAALAVAPRAPRAAALDPLAFDILRAGEHIGRHEVAFAPLADGFTARTQIDVAIKLGPFTAYAFRQEAFDRWRDGRLVESRIATDDNGEASTIQAVAEADRLLIVGPEGALSAPLGLMTDLCFWNGAIVDQDRLLGTRVGDLRAIRAERTSVSNLILAGNEVETACWQILADDKPLGLVWYDAQSRWVHGRLYVKGERLDYVLVQ